MRQDRIKMSKKDIKRTKKTEERRRKQHDSSDDSDDSSWTGESDDDLDVHEYHKLLSQLYPSKHINKKVVAGKKLKKTLQKEVEESEEYDTESEEEQEPKKNRKTREKKHKNKRIVVSESEEEADNDEETLGSQDTNISDSEEEECDEESCNEKDHKSKNIKGGKLNIIFTIGGGHNEDEDDEEYYDEEDIWETTSDAATENEDDPVSSDSSSNDEADKEESEEESEEEDIKPRKNKTKSKEKVKDKVKDKKKSDKKLQSENTENDVLKQLKDIVTSAEKNTTKDKKDNTTEDNLLIMLKELQDKNSDNEIIKECLRVCEEKMEKRKKKEEKKNKKTKDRNERIFKKIITDKNTMNDFEFFNKLEVEQQKKIIKELREINKISRVEKPYRLTLLESDIPVVFKSAAMKKISNLRYMDTGSGEYYKIKNWVDAFMRIPFGKYQTLPINISDGVENCHNFMETAQKTLDNAVYGLNDAKMQIMQMLGQLITNPKSIGSAIAIHGPPGTGKTSLVKEGISKILNRPFAFIALGGATDSSFLEGHGYTYEGSTWGKIVQILIDSKCMNPVIYFDELDKISETPKGEEIAGILTHLTDTTQNSQFHDKYFSEIDFDLSKCLFIFSYNDESKVNPILKDRMYRIQTMGYNQKQKTIIAKDYLLPKIREQVHFSNDEIVIPDQTIHYLIENHCNKEDGVRNLKRCMEIIHTKLNLYRLMKPGSNLFEEDMSLKVEFPFVVTKDIVDKLIKDKKELNSALSYLYV
jgi:ATP-dependent Lon protease